MVAKKRIALTNKEQGDHQIDYKQMANLNRMLYNYQFLRLEKLQDFAFGVIAFVIFPMNETWSTVPTLYVNILSIIF